MLRDFIQAMTPISRAEHMALRLDLKEVQMERDIAKAERSVAEQEHTAAVNRELAAIEQRDAYNAIATRALVLLIERVDTTRTGGKQLAHFIAAVKADAIKCGLWGEVKE